MSAHNKATSAMDAIAGRWVAIFSASALAVFGTWVLPNIALQIGDAVWSHRHSVFMRMGDVRGYLGLASALFVLIIVWTALAVVFLITIAVYHMRTEQPRIRAAFTPSYPNSSVTKSIMSKNSPVLPILAYTGAIVATIFIAVAVAGSVSCVDNEQMKQSVMVLKLYNGGDTAALRAVAKKVYFEGEPPPTIDTVGTGLFLGDASFLVLRTENGAKVLMTVTKDKLEKYGDIYMMSNATSGTYVKTDVGNVISASAGRLIHMDVREGKMYFHFKALPAPRAPLLASSQDGILAKLVGYGISSEDLLNKDSVVRSFFVGEPGTEADHFNHYMWLSNSSNTAGLALAHLTVTAEYAVKNRLMHNHTVDQLDLNDIMEAAMWCDVAMEYSAVVYALYGAVTFVGMLVTLVMRHCTRCCGKSGRPEHGYRRQAQHDRSSYSSKKPLLSDGGLDDDTQWGTSTYDSR